jgi:hypothetical protein
MRLPLVAAAILALASPLAAQHEHHAPDAGHAHAGGEFPEGWSARVDRDQPVDQIMFMAMGEGFHAVTGPAAVFHNPAWTRSGDYEVSARFTQNRAPRNPESYGIAIGGRDLDGPAQDYLYFLVRGTGEYFLAHRAGDERHVLVNWTAHPAVQKQDDAGRQANVLGARVAGADVVFTVNGTEITRLPQAQVNTDGIFGFRVNHTLDVGIDQIRR